MLKLNGFICDFFEYLGNQGEFKKTTHQLFFTGQTAQVVRRLLLVREVWGSNLEPIKSPTRCQRLATAATLMCWGPGAKPQSWAAHS